jgi:adenylosuccinate lyase
MDSNVNIGLLNISPIDGRYKKKTRDLNTFFSEYGLIKYRLMIEIKYLILLINILKLEVSNKEHEKINNIIYKFNYNEANKIKEYEKKCNHDVKAIEYYIREKLNEFKLEHLNCYIHYGLTSQDINNMAITYSINDFITSFYYKKLTIIIDNINKLSSKWYNIIMICKTHGQPAVPSTLGKEFKVFSYRLEKQFTILQDIKYYGKFGGAIGNLNAHYFSYPNINWDEEFDKFVSSFGLIREQYTTQIDNYENLAVVFDCLRRINTILIDFNRDIWSYISINYFDQKFDINEVGSSTMPQKINPINFENSEGNLMIANNLLDFMSNKLPVSRFQRDLTDSTVLRNVGTIFGHIFISFDNLLTGLNKIVPNEQIIQNDCHNNYSVLSEGLQTILRKNNIENGYEIIKKYFRNNSIINKEKFEEIINDLVNTLNIKEEDKLKLKNLSHYNYIGNVNKK